MNTCHFSDQEFSCQNLLVKLSLKFKTANTLVYNNAIMIA